MRQTRTEVDELLTVCRSTSPANELHQSINFNTVSKSFDLLTTTTQLLVCEYNTCCMSTIVLKGPQKYLIFKKTVQSVYQQGDFA